MKAIITVVGNDMVGILARVCGICMECNVNIIDVTQTVMENMFTMTMMVDLGKATVPFDEFSDRMTGLGKEMNLTIHTMHEDIFNSMHRI